MLHLARVFYQPMEYESEPPAYWKGKTVVVIDVLRATSTLVTALGSGYAEARCFREVAAARSYAADHPGAVLAGEREGLPPEGFEKGNSPREFVQAPVAGTALALTTTNGTRALESVRGAERILVGSFLNLHVVADFLQKAGAVFEVVCSGTGDAFALEDALVAGALAELLHLEHAVAALYRSCAGSLGEAFRASRNGRRLKALGLDGDLDGCLQRDRFPVLPMLGRDGVIRPTKPS